MNLLRVLLAFKKVSSTLLLLGDLLTGLGRALSGPPTSGQSSEQDSLTHGVESEKPEDDTQTDQPQTSDTIISLEEGRSILRAERHSPEPPD